MSEMWNKTAQDVTNMSFVTNGMDDATRPADMPGSFDRPQYERLDNNDKIGTVPIELNEIGSCVDPTPDYGATEVEEDVIGGQQVRPVVGWLVCTRGADLGKDFHIFGGYNTIGRSDAYAPSKPTVDLSDKHVSRDAAMVLSYDALYNEYTLSKVVDSETVCRYNKKMIHGSIELKPYDRVTLGKREEVELMFIPLCGEQFSWEEDEEEK